MKRVVALFFILLCTSALTQAQTYTEHIQKVVAGQGIVTIKQSAEIDELVNGKKATEKSDTVSKTNNAPIQVGKVGTNKKDTPAKVWSGDDNTDDELNIPTVDTSRKVMRGGYKTDGFRVQAFAGGNSRNDKIKAQQIGNRIKTACPDQPVYVHFYSPRWICRIGNFKSMEEATMLLERIKALGYTQAVIVKGKITVQY